MGDFQERPGAEDEVVAGMGPKAQALAEEAAAATSEAMTADPDLDVQARLRSEMSQRGLNITDDRWLHDVAEEIRAAHPGSMGGDNGGG